jgi:hypothetical protein
MARLTGPGKVWLQSLTVPGLAHAIAPYIKSNGAETTAAAQGAAMGAAGTQLFNDIFGRR